MKFMFRLMSRSIKKCVKIKSNDFFFNFFKKESNKRRELTHVVTVSMCFDYKFPGEKLKEDRAEGGKELSSRASCCISASCSCLR